nr:metal-dependent transcriptional regulator [uncultured Blautia sp.]
MRSMKESREDYLEAILILNRKRPEDVRPVDVANYLELTKPSVTRAMGELEKEGHVVRNAKGRILLTESGKRIAENVYEKHCVITELFQKCASVPEKTAELDACKVEHVISDETFRGLKEYLSRNTEKEENK